MVQGVTCWSLPAVDDADLPVLTDTEDGLGGRVDHHEASSGLRRDAVRVPQRATLGEHRDLAVRRDLEHGLGISMGDHIATIWMSGDCKRKLERRALGNRGGFARTVDPGQSALAR